MLCLHCMSGHPLIVGTHPRGEGEEGDAFDRRHRRLDCTVSCLIWMVCEPETLMIASTRLNPTPIQGKDKRTERGLGTAGRAVQQNAAPRRRERPALLALDTTVLLILRRRGGEEAGEGVGIAEGPLQRLLQPPLRLLLPACWIVLDGVSSSFIHPCTKQHM